MLCATDIEMVLIRPHGVELEPFYVAKTPVVQSLFYEIMGSNLSAFKGDSLPAERVSWYEALAFCNLLSVAHGFEPVYIYYSTYFQKDQGSKDVYEWIRGWGGIPTHRVVAWNRIVADSNADGYRLLTQDEWDFLYHAMDESIIANLEDFAWVYLNSEERTHPVASKLPDSNELFDFLGNVKEWLFDDVGDLSEGYFMYKNPEQEAFYSSLGFRKFKNRDFYTLRDHRGFYPVLRSPLIGFRVARNST